MTLASRLSRGVLEALEDPALELELLAGAPWWPRAAATCSLRVLQAIRGSLPDYPPDSPEARLIAEGIINQAPIVDALIPGLALAREHLTHARELVALGPATATWPCAPSRSSIG